MKLDIPPDLANRLIQAARRLKRAPEDCALSAISAFVTDCEEAQALASRFGDGVARLGEDDFMD